jgi:hypothetical protein
MNRATAYQLLTAELAAHRDIGYAELCKLVGEQMSQRAKGVDGVEYEISIHVQWCNQVDGDICVTGSIGETAWGSPHDSLDDTIVVPRQSTASA